MIVLKFGGTSVGTAESLANVKKIVEGLGQEAVVVVSALGGLTDRLIATARLAATGSDDYIPEWEAMAKRHYDIIERVVEKEEQKIKTLEVVTPLLEELRRLYQGVSLINFLPEPTLARIVSLGERMSSVIVANMLGARHVDSLKIIKTEKWFDKNIASTDLTTELIRGEFSETEYPVVMGGFISSDRESEEITNLGRGGSDYTAALVAAALDAEVLQIWTDVDGFLTADPRIVADAKVIDSMSFVESMDLCNFGAKVIYPPTIYPVFHKNIPIRILNTHRPEAPGTLISDHPQGHTPGIVGLSALKSEALITLRGRLAYDATIISSRSFNALARKGLSAHLQAKSGPHNSFAFAIAESEAEQALRLIREEFAPELNDGMLEAVELRGGLASLAAVGDNIKQIASISGLMLNILQNAEIEVLAYSDKASETALSYVIKEEDVAPALKLLHKAFFSSPEPPESAGI